MEGKDCHRTHLAYTGKRKIIITIILYLGVVCRHPRVVGLLDIFERDSCTFATVLELCEGHDLDLHLQRHQVCVCVCVCVCVPLQPLVPGVMDTPCIRRAHCMMSATAGSI